MLAGIFSRVDIQASKKECLTSLNSSKILMKDFPISSLLLLDGRTCYSYTMLLLYTNEYTSCAFTLSASPLVINT